MSQTTLGKFLDANSYLVGSQGTTFYTNKASPPSFNLPYTTTFVTTSDVGTRQSCYQLSTSSLTTPRSLSTDSINTATSGFVTTNTAITF
jgi:hypothetical protein